MRRRRDILLWAALACALADCGASPKTHYFTLAAAPAAESKQVSISRPVTVAAVHVPPSLDRRSMVRRTSETTVDVSGEDRWTAPLGDMMQRVLSQDLAARLPRDKVILPDAPAPPHTAQIVVTVVQFGPDASGRTVLEGGWSLLEGAPARPVLRRDVALRTDREARDAEDQAAAMSQLLGQLATGIAAALAEPR